MQNNTSVMQNYTMQNDTAIMQNGSQIIEKYTELMQNYTEIMQAKKTNLINIFYLCPLARALCDQCYKAFLDYWKLTLIS